ELTIRSALSGESVPCYKVSAEAGGRKVEGYLPGPLIDGLDDFDKARRSAAWLDMSQIMGSIKETAAPKSSIAGAPANPLAAQAQALIEEGSPGKALELLESELKQRRNPGMLALAGVAAWRADESPKALEYWRASLELAPNPALEKLIQNVERETKSDKSGD